MPDTELPLIAIVAIARNGAIGRDGALPWHMPGDLARFRALTIGRPMVMGRRTFDAIGRALPGRDSVVVTRRPADAFPDGVDAAASPEAALLLAGRRARERGAREIALIGGTELFRALGHRIGAWRVTLVDLAPAADTFLPMPDPWLWRETARVRPPRDPRDEADCVFLDFERA